MLNLNEARDLGARIFFMASIVITDYSRAIYGENSLIDGEKEKGRGTRGVARTWKEKKGELW